MCDKKAHADVNFLGEAKFNRNPNTIIASLVSISSGSFHKHITHSHAPII